MKGKLETGLRVVGLLAFLYVAAYFAAVRRGPVFQWSGHWVAWPRYVALSQPAEVCFGRLHEWDRAVLRPGFWAGTISPEELRKQQLLIMEVFRRDLQAAAKQE
jgi:hypothetical protein